MFQLGAERPSKQQLQKQNERTICEYNQGGKEETLWPKVIIQEKLF